MPKPAQKKVKKAKKKTGADKRLRIGWFSFACCEDSTIMMTELLNDYWQDWKKRINFVHARVLQSKNELKNIDVAFVEGSIATKKDEQELKKIRKNSAHVVAIGACACDGMPAAQRNTFDPELKKEIAIVLERFKHRDKVVPIDNIVKVDDKVPGCPMQTDLFLKTLNKYFRKYNLPAVKVK